MENPPLVLSMENIKDNETLLYFATVVDDDRIDQLFDSGERVAEFDFIGHTKYDIHPTLLSKNFVDDDGLTFTAFHAQGRYTQTDETQFQLRLMGTSGNAKKSIVIDAAADSLFLHEAHSDIFEQLDKKSFGDLALRAANLHPAQVRKNLGLGRSSPIFNTHEDIYNFWCELSQERQGSTHVRGAFCQEIDSSDGKTTEIRVAQKDYELPDQSIREITIEHATQLHDLDAEVIYRLELTYASIDNDKKSFAVEKRVISGCERELVNARLTSRNSSGVITPLDINDTTLMKQFQGALEIALQSA